MGFTFHNYASLFYNHLVFFVFYNYFLHVYECVFKPAEVNNE